MCDEPILSLNVYTAQLAQWRKVRALGLEITDTTVRSGDKRLAPTWDMVMEHKSGTLDDFGYTERYIVLMDKSIKNYPDFWQDLILRKNLVLCCYCASGKFCHRHLLKDIIRLQCDLQGIHFHDMGEIG